MQKVCIKENFVITVWKPHNICTSASRSRLFPILLTTY